VKEAKPGIRDFTYAPQAYDAVTITALAAAIARTDAPTMIAQQINNVTKGGQKCPGFKECMDLIKAGIDIDYDGASGPLDFTNAGEPSSATYLVVQFQPDGSLTTTGTQTIGF
jgi:branched-chain amino acid transport system substrate-binding protein